MKTTRMFTWIFIFLHIVTTSRSDGSKKFQKHFDKPLSVSWTITDFDIIVKIEPNPNWPNVTVEYEVFTKYFDKDFWKERWRKRPCKPKAADSVTSNDPYFCDLDFTLNYDYKLKVKARAKWDQMIVNGTKTEIVTRFSTKKKTDVLLDVFKQGGFTAPSLDNVVANDNSVIFDISISNSDVTCQLRNVIYHFAAVDITDEENYDCSGHLSVINSSVATATKDHPIIFFPKTERDKHLTECEEGEKHMQAVNLGGFQPGKKYCLEANYDNVDDSRNWNLTIKSQFIHHLLVMPKKEPSNKIWLVPIILSVYAIAVILLYYIYWIRKRQRKMNKTKKEFYEDQKSLLERDNMYSSVKDFDLTNEEPEADMIPSAHQTEVACEMEVQNSETESFELQVVDKDEKKPEINPVEVEEENVTEVEEFSKKQNHPKTSLIDSGMESYDDSSRNSSICAYPNQQQLSHHQHLPSPEGYVQKDSFSHNEPDKDSGGCGLAETSFKNTHNVDRQLLF